jgi:hypothetical protein
VITKPLAVGQDRFQPMVLILDSPAVWEDNVLQVVGHRSPRTVPTGQVNLSQVDRLTIGPMGGSGIRDALHAYLLDHGFAARPL